MRIDIPEGQHPIEYVWGDMVPGIGMAAANFSLSVYAHTTLGLREFEAARLRVAQINGCVFCLDWRTERDGEKVEEEFSDAVAEWRTTDAFDVGAGSGSREPGAGSREPGGGAERGARGVCRKRGPFG
ncbi:hypothetical protein SAVIM40S_07342 [Streptomyces avidinii]